MPENGARNERLWLLPQIIPASASSTMNRPRVTITALIGGLSSTGRMIVRSTTAPSTKPAAMAATNATQ